jgi:hypothetical protein
VSPQMGQFAQLTMLDQAHLHTLSFGGPLCPLKIPAEYWGVLLVTLVHCTQTRSSEARGGQGASKQGASMGAVEQRESRLMLMMYNVAPAALGPSSSRARGCQSMVGGHLQGPMGPRLPAFPERRAASPISQIMARPGGASPGGFLARKPRRPPQAKSGATGAPQSGALPFVASTLARCPVSGGGGGQEHRGQCLWHTQGSTAVNRHGNSRRGAACKHQCWTPHCGARLAAGSCWVSKHRPAAMRRRSGRARSGHGPAGPAFTPSPARAWHLLATRRLPIILL